MPEILYAVVRDNFKLWWSQLQSFEPDRRVSIQSKPRPLSVYSSVPLYASLFPRLFPHFVGDSGIKNSPSQRSYFDPRLELAYFSDEIKPKESEAPFRKLFQAARFILYSCCAFICLALGIAVLRHQVPRSRDVSSAVKSGFLGLAFILIGGMFIWIILQV
jgi:hypothetical protein